MSFITLTNSIYSLKCVGVCSDYRNVECDRACHVENANGNKFGFHFSEKKIYELVIINQTNLNRNV